MKLNELLAIESNLEGQAAKCRTELAATFEKKRHLFEQKKVQFLANTEGAQPQVEVQSDIQSTVTKELAWVRDFIRKNLDASYQVAEANMIARADIVLEDQGQPLAKGVPATALLELEKRVSSIGELVKSIPTLDPAKGFTRDESAGEGIYQARPVTKTRTHKQPEVITKAPATKEHAAQTELIYLDKPIGTIQEQEWSGLITPAEKADLINRVEILTRAIRRARARANEAEVDTGKKIAQALLGYIFG